MSGNLKKKMHSGSGHGLVVRNTFGKVHDLLPPPEVTLLEINLGILKEVTRKEAQ